MQLLTWIVSLFLTLCLHAHAATVFAIGDIHGDLAAAKKALSFTGLVNSSGKWIGKDAILVQLGDRIDRGSEDRAVMDLFEDLVKQAALQGGAVYPILGNHEIYNVSLDFREITTSSYQEFSEFFRAGTPEANDPAILAFPPIQRGRAVAFRPGGAYARLIASHPAIVKVGSTVFVHGGILPEFAEEGIEQFNTDIRLWMTGSPAGKPPYLSTKRNPFFDRTFALSDDESMCAILEESLNILQADRMVVGHTPQMDGITSACNGKIWRVDTGMSAYFGGKVEVLRIVNDKIVSVINDSSGLLSAQLPPSVSPAPAAQQH